MQFHSAVHDVEMIHLLIIKAFQGNFMHYAFIYVHMKTRKLSEIGMVIRGLYSEEKINWNTTSI